MGARDAQHVHAPHPPVSDSEPFCLEPVEVAPAVQDADQERQQQVQWHAHGANADDRHQCGIQASDTKSSCCWLVVQLTESRSPLALLRHCNCISCLRLTLGRCLFRLQGRCFRLDFWHTIAFTMHPYAHFSTCACTCPHAYTAGSALLTPWLQCCASRSPSL